MRQALGVAVALFFVSTACNGPRFWFGKKDRTCYLDKSTAAIDPTAEVRQEQEVFGISTAWCYSLSQSESPICLPTEAECEATRATCFEMKPEQHPEAGN